MRTQKILLVIFIFSLQLSAGYSQMKPVLDKIVAVVGNEIILKSELDYQVQLVAYQNKLNPDDAVLRQKVLDAMIN
ncbi:MAG: hypothetical protein ACPL1K_06845, partial [Candidatus Kryptoniota bacterium]